MTRVLLLLLLLLDQLLRIKSGLDKSDPVSLTFRG